MKREVKEFSFFTHGS